MKNKAFLSITEQLLMILFFALAAALALKGFSLAENLTRQRQIKEFSTFAVENTAETIKSCSGDFRYAAQQLSAEGDEDTLVLSFSPHGTKLPQNTTEENGFTVVAEKTKHENPYIGSAHISSIYQGTVIFELDVYWQEDFRQ